MELIQQFKLVSMNGPLAPEQWLAHLVLMVWLLHLHYQSPMVIVIMKAQYMMWYNSLETQEAL